MPPQHPSGFRHGILRIVLIYAAFAAAWILFSDKAAALFFPDVQDLVLVSTVKGWLFVAATSLLLYGLMLRQAGGGETALDQVLLRGGILDWPRWSLYALAGAASAATLWLSLEMARDFADRPLLIILVFPVILSAMLGGVGPGLLATLLTALGIAWYGIAPKHSLAMAAERDVIHWLFLVVDGVLVSALAEFMRSGYQQSASALAEKVRALSLLGSIAEASDDAIFAKDAEGRYLMFNRAAREFVGQPAEAVIGKDDRGLFPPQQAAMLIAIDRRILATGAIETNEESVDTPTGRKVLLATKGPLRDADGRIFGVFGIARDISERKRMESALAAEVEKNRLLLRAASDGVHILDANGSVLEVSDTFCAMLGYTRDELIGANVSLWDAQWAPQELVRIVRSQIETMQRTVFETRHRRRDGRLIDVEVTGQALTLDAKQVLFNASRDITERKLVQETLRRNAEEYRSLIETMSDGLLVVGEDARVREANNAYCRMLGYQREELIGMSITQLECIESAPAVEKRVARIMATGGDRFEFRHRHKDGRAIDVEVSITYVASSGRFFSFFREIAERKRLEAARLNSQRMESLGTLAGGIAHDFNNILAAIRGNAELAAQDVAGNEAAAQSIAEIQKAGARATELIRRIMTFGSPREPQRRVVELGGVVNEALRLLRPTLGANIALVERSCADVAPVLADADQVHEAVVNLTTNAAYAIGRQPGRIEYALATLELKGVDAAALGLDDGRYTRLSVSDTGRGMDEATRARAFDAFFTTKPVGEGSGLGLSMVHGIMKSHGGAVAVESAPGQGAVFHLYFPATRSEGGARKRPKAGTAVSAAARRVLFVDDEEALVFLAQRALAHFGHSVAGFTDPQAALDAFRADPAAFDVVVTDLSMPGMSGFELTRALRDVRPGVPVLVMTGYIRADDEAEARNCGVRSLLLKPSTMDELARMLDRDFAGALGQGTTAADSEKRRG